MLKVSYFVLSHSFGDQLLRVVLYRPSWYLQIALEDQTDNSCHLRRGLLTAFPFGVTMFVEQNSQIVSIQIFSMKFIGFIGDFLSQFGSQREAESHE